VTHRKRFSSLPRALKILHWFLIVNFAVNVLYAAYQVFFVLVPEGHLGPLGAAASEVSPDLMMTRRMYAIEAWISIAGLAIYLAITEYLPRLLAARSEGG
jgi:hypothetical protein